MATSQRLSHLGWPAKAATEPTIVRLACIRANVVVVGNVVAVVIGVGGAVVACIAG